MQTWSTKKQILFVLWANFPLILQFLNDTVNRRSPQREPINDFLNVLVFANLAVLISVAIVSRMRAKKKEEQYRAMENESWNEQMTLRYKNWGNV
jgi:c-di-GMP-related signal transduction protein